MQRNASEALIQIEPDVWDRHLRRLMYAEAALLQHDNGGDMLPVWATPEELARIETTGLPESPDAFEAFAMRLCIELRWRNGNADGSREYNLLSFPWAILRPIIGLMRGEMGDPWDAYPPASVGDPLRNTVPPWVLPLARLMRIGSVQTATEALDMLAVTLPPRIKRPTLDEVMAFMQDH